MPHVDLAAERRRINRALAKSRKVGDFITCDAAPALSVMIVNGRPVTMRPPLTEAERKAEDDRWWRISCGPW
jgi:hypothetical protein